jgi:hypothetical protein
MKDTNTKIAPTTSYPTTSYLNPLNASKARPGVWTIKIYSQENDKAKPKLETEITRSYPFFVTAVAGGAVQTTEMDQMVGHISETNRERAAYLVEKLGAGEAVDMIARAISHLAVSRTARKYGDLGSAEGALDAARDLLIKVLGIETE